MTIGLGQYLGVAAILFTIGVFGIFMNRRNVIVMLMSIELILLAVNINLVAFSAFLGDMVGQVFALFVLPWPRRKLPSALPFLSSISVTAAPSRRKTSTDERLRGPSMTRQLFSFRFWVFSSPVWAGASLARGHQKL